MAERTGCPVLLNLWSYVTTLNLHLFISTVNARLEVIGAGQEWTEVNFTMSDHSQSKITNRPASIETSFLGCAANVSRKPATVSKTRFSKRSFLGRRTPPKFCAPRLVSTSSPTCQIQPNAETQPHLARPLSIFGSSPEKLGRSLAELGSERGIHLRVRPRGGRKEASGSSLWHRATSEVVVMVEGQGWGYGGL